LKKHDPVGRIHFIIGFFGLFVSVFSDEEGFSLCREVNFQNNWHLNEENPRLILELPVNDETVGI
jgi:hypothetical protein